MDTSNRDDRYIDETFGNTILWRITNFDAKPSFDYLQSQIFEIQSMNSNWQIEIKVEGSCLAAYLYKVTNHVPFFVNYNLSLLSGLGWITILENERERFQVDGNGFGGDLVDLATLKKDEWFYLSDGSLTICFHLWNNHVETESCRRLMISKLIDGDSLLHRPIQTLPTLKPSNLSSSPLSYEFQNNSVPASDDGKTIKETKSQQTQTESTFNFKDFDDLRKLFREKEFSFVTLKTSTKEFSVHKALLCAKSPVFNAMFEAKMIENDSNVVDIDDIDSETMALLVNFLHFEPVGDLEWSRAVSLYYAADKYQIDSLREQCVSFLKTNLSNENVCGLLLLADMHQDDDLMNRAQEYFCEHSKAILPSSQWKDILGHTELIAKVLCKLAETME